MIYNEIDEANALRQGRDRSEVLNGHLQEEHLHSLDQVLQAKEDLNEEQQEYQGLASDHAHLWSELQAMKQAHLLLVPPGLPIVTPVAKVAAAAVKAAAPAPVTAEVDAEADGLPKIKEGDKVIVPPFPNITTIQSWQTALLQNVVATSGHREIRPVVR